MINHNNSILNILKTNALNLSCKLEKQNNNTIFLKISLNELIFLIFLLLFD